MRDWILKHSAHGWPWERRGFYVDRDGDDDYVSVSLRWVCFMVWFRNPGWKFGFSRRPPWGGPYLWLGPVHVELTEAPREIWGDLRSAEV